MSQPLHSLVQMVSTAELRTVLEHALHHHFGKQCCITKLERQPSAYRTGFALEELNVHLDDGTTLELIVKDVNWQALLENARRAKPLFLYHPAREIETYRAILTPHRLNTATCYGAVVDHELGCYWLFIERVPGVRLANVGEFVIWQEACRWLAVMHTHFANEIEWLTQVAPLLKYDGDFYMRWMDRALAFSRRASSAQSLTVRRSIEWLAERYGQVIEHLVALPVTFIHGEFYASNVLVQETPGGLRVCPVDWEMAAVGPGLFDLAALTAGTWSEEEKAALALAYQAALMSDGKWPSTPGAIMTALDYCQLHLAVQWLGWSTEWSPPPEQAQDWLREALRLAEKLEL
jgi:hypothetical protein